MAAVQFSFVRHGEATHNADVDIRGYMAYYDPIHTDAALTAKGEIVASSQLLEGPFDAIYCSPLRRCRQTLLRMYPGALHLPVHLDDRLMEPQGKLPCNRRIERAQLAEECPPTWSLDGVAELNPYFSAHEWHANPIGTCPLFTSRVCGITDDIVTRHAGQRVLIVAHFEWIRHWFYLFKKELREPVNCELLQAEYGAKS